MTTKIITVPNTQQCGSTLANTKTLRYPLSVHTQTRASLFKYVTRSLVNK